ncbi:hypothetical protein [Bifidobacterium simiarum]|nr:hypothetical protein [Bifidobacterium simiarum]
MGFRLITAIVLACWLVCLLAACAHLTRVTFRGHADRGLVDGWMVVMTWTLSFVLFLAAGIALLI